MSRAVQSGETIWAGGQWAFLEYAQRAGARGLANQPPYPQPGDLILISRLSYYGQFESEGEQPESAETSILAEPEAEPPSETGAAGAESSDGHGIGNQWRECSTL